MAKWGINPVVSHGASKLSWRCNPTLLASNCSRKSLGAWELLTKELNISATVQWLTHLLVLLENIVQGFPALLCHFFPVRRGGRFWIRGGRDQFENQMYISAIGNTSQEMCHVNKVQLSDLPLTISSYASFEIPSGDSSVWVDLTSAFTRFDPFSSSMAHCFLLGTTFPTCK